MIEIYNEDCLTGMDNIDTGSIDFILTDLPYGITDAPFDTRIDFNRMWKQFWRVTKPNAAIMLFGVAKFAIELAASQLKYYRYEWIWEKNLPVGFLNAKRMPMRTHENILVFYKTLPTYNPQKFQSFTYHRRAGAGHKTANYHRGKYLIEKDSGDVSTRYPRDVLKFRTSITMKKSERSGHAQQKPTALLEYLIRTYTNEGETVLDATMGSGSTGVACINTGRKFIGYELDEDIFNSAKLRLEKAETEKAQQLVLVE